MVGDGEYYIPVTHQFWIKKEKTDLDYRTKHAIAKELIRSIIQHCKIRIVLADALYATVEFMKELNQLNLRFEMKIHANRINGRR
jgi:SRSO17 transposase